MILSRDINNTGITYVYESVRYLAIVKWGTSTSSSLITNDALLQKKMSSIQMKDWLNASTIYSPELNGWNICLFDDDSCKRQDPSNHCTEIKLGAVVRALDGCNAPTVSYYFFLFLLLWHSADSAATLLLFTPQDQG